jgi:hypothetical protein
MVHSAQTALDTGQAVIVAAGGSRLRDIHQRLSAGRDLDLAIRQGRYISLDEAEASGAILVDGWPDDALFWTKGTALMLRAARASLVNAVPVAACGECCGSLARAGRLDAAIRLEHLWDELANTFNADMFCPYLMEVPGPGEQRDAFERISSVHSSVHSQ